MSYVVLPSGAYTKIREGETAQDALSRAQRDHPNEFSLNPPKKEAEPQGGFGAAFSAGLSRLAGETGLTAGKAGIVDLATAEEYYRQQQEKQRRIFKPTEKGWTEDPLLKLREVAGGSAAYMLGPLLAGGAAAFAPVSVPVIGTAGLAAGLTSLGQFTGSNLAAQMEENKKGLAETSGALATVTALPQAALDLLSLRMMPGIREIFKATGRQVTEAEAKALAAQTLKQKIGDYAAATGISMGVEGATEVVQDFLEKAQAGAQLTDPKARADYLESLIGGAALAAVLGPFGRGFERRGIAERGRQLEEERLTANAEMQKSMARLAKLEQQRLIDADARQQFGTLFAEIGPASPLGATPEAAPARLAAIEKEVAEARQKKDMDALLRLQRERTFLESQGPAFELQQQQQRVEALRKREAALRNAIESTPDETVKNRLSNQLELLSAERAQAEMELGQQQQAEAKPDFEKRRDLEKRISALESLEVKLQERADAATLAGRQPILASLASVQEQLRVARSELEAGEKSGALPKTEKSDAPLLKREQAAIKALLAARETGSGAAQALAAGRLNQIEEQLGLFGMESFAANERSAAEQRRREEEAEAARLAAQKPPILTDQRGATPIEMGINTELFPTVPYKPGPYTQETLFGPPERVRTPSQTELTIPQIQSTVAQLKERANLSPQDQMMLARLRQKENLTRIERALLTRLEEKTALSPEDQALLERVENVAVPAPGVNIPEALQTRLTALQGVRQRIEQQLLQRGERALQEEEEVAPAAEPEKEAAPVETPPVNTLPAPIGFKHRVLEKPAYEGVEALSREDAEFELEVLLREAERGRLTPEWFSRSVIGRMLDTAQMTEVNSNIRQDPVAAVQGLIAAIKPAEAKPAEAKPAEAEAKPEPKATYKYMRDEYGNLVPILVESKKKAAPVAETAAKAETEAEAETEVEEEERLSDAAKLKLLRQKMPMSPLTKRLDRLDRIEKELTEKLRSADRKAGTLLEKLTGRDEQNVTLRQRISDWLSDTAQGRGNEESRRALEEALLRVEQGQRGEKQPLTTLQRRIATQEESKLLGGKKTITERVPTGEAITAQQPELFADTEAASAVEFKTPEELQAFMASEKLQQERAEQGKQALREAQEAGPPRPDELKKAQRLLRPTIAYLNKQIVGLKNVIKRLTGRVDNYNTMLQVRTEEQEDALIKAKKQLAEVILAISKTLVSQHQKYAQAKLELDNAKNVYAGLDEFKKAVEEAMGQALDRASDFARFQTKVKESIEKDLAEKKAAFDAAFVKLRLLRDEIVDVDFGEARDKYLTPPRQKMTEAVDPYLEIWPAYNRALKETQDAFKAIQDSLEENIGRPMTRPETAVVLDEEISNFLEQDAELTEMLIGQRRTVYMYEREVAAAKEALDSARQDQEKDPVWSAFLKEAEEAIKAATDIPKKDLLTEPVALKKAIVAANKQINNLKAQQRDRSIQEQIRQLEEEKDKITMRMKDFSLGYRPPFTPEEQAALKNKTTTLQEIADNRRARIASIDQQINALRKELTTTTLRGERQAKAAQERAEKQAKTQAEIRAENERLQRAAASALQVSGLTPEQREAIEKAQKDIDSVLEAKAEAIEAKQKQTSNFRLSDELKKDVAAKQKAVRAEVAKKLKEEKDEKKKAAIREQAAKDIAKIEADAREVQRAADIQKIEAAFKPQIEKAIAKAQQLRAGVEPEVAQSDSSQRFAEAIAQFEKTQRLTRTSPVLVDVRTGRISEPSRDVDDSIANQAKERALLLQFLLGEETTKVLGRQLRPSEFEKDTLAELRGKAEKIRQLQQKALEKAAAQKLTPEQVEEADRMRRAALIKFLRSPESRRVLDVQFSAATLKEASLEKLEAVAADVRELIQRVKAAELTQAANKETTVEAKKDKTSAAAAKKAIKKSKSQEDTAVDDPLDRIISHDYTARENTPLDQTTAAAVGKGDLKSALESLAENGSTPFVRMVAKQLLPMVENTTLETASLEGKGGEFDPNTNTITLNADALTEEDLLHEAGHAATNAVASYEAKEFGMTRRQFMQGAGAVLTAVKLPDIPANLSLAEQERMFFNMLDAWRDWVSLAKRLQPALDLDPYLSLDVSNRNLRGFLTRLEYADEVADYEIVEMLESGGLKNLHTAINASQRAIMSEATKQSEGKPTKEKFVPTKEQLAARDALEKLYAKMQERPEFKGEYGNVSFKEFVSELLSNQQVRDKIDQTAGLLRRIYEGFLRMLGFNPKTLSDKAVEQAFAMFSPSQASVTPQERLASISRGIFPGTATKYSSAVPKEVQDMVNRTIARTATLGDKITANATGLRMRTFIADSWAPVEALLKMGVAKDKIKEAQALQMRVYMRLFSNQQEYTNAALLNGVPELKTDADGVRNIEGGDARANAKTIAAALSKASKLGNQQAVERTFTMWMASLRAKQDGVSFAKLNFKNPPTAAELTALEQMLKDNKDVKDAFEEARRLYKEHNKRLLNLQVQTGAMSKEVADELGKGDYVGYYRVNDNGVVELMMGGSRPMRIGSVVDQPYLKELVGGEQHILPFFSSMVQNTSMLMTIALRNVQNDATANMFKKMELGEIIKVDEGSKAPVGKIHFKRDGDEYWFNADADAFEAAGIPADLMMQGLQGVKTTIPGLVRALAVPANFLRKAVRRLPTYTLRQTIRDPMHAWMVTGGKFTPVLSTWKELYKGMTNTSQTQMTLKEAAIVGNNVYSGDTEGVADMLRQLSGNQSQFAKRMMQLDELAMKGEAATRAVLYDTFRQKGMGHVEALLNTAETMNFGRRGTSASLQWLSMLTPFFNAQIQGLDSVYRSLKGDNTFEQKMNARNMLLKRGALLAASTMMYALMMEDDEAYKNATPAERYGNWFVPVPGTDKTIRVPIPFELGLIFKSMPEAFVNTAFGDTKAKEAIKALAKQTYMSSPFGIPTAVKGPLELAFNYNMYSDQPVETARERAVDTDQRYRESTTEVAKLLGKFGVLSPVQIDHLVRSYMSSTGIALLSMANFALRPLTTREGVEKPDWVLEEVPVIGPLFQPKTGRGMVNAAFQDMMRIERAAQTYKTLAGSDPEAARAYADDYAKQISLAPLGGQFRQQMGEFAKYKRMVAMNPNLTAAEKRAQIEKIKQQEIQYSTMLRKVAA